jgi:ketosteroid isomerase-like protein
MKALMTQITLLIIIFLTACTAKSNLTSEQLEIEKEKIRQADIAWAKTGETKNLDAQMKLYSDDQIPILMPSNSPLVKGKENIRAFFEPTYSRSDFSITWHPETVEVAESGEIGFVIGVYDSQINDTNGNPIRDKGKYIEIWKKQKDGSWKCTADIFNSDISVTEEYWGEEN